MNLKDFDKPGTTMYQKRRFLIHAHRPITIVYETSVFLFQKGTFSPQLLEASPFYEFRVSPGTSLWPAQYHLCSR